MKKYSSGSRVGNSSEELSPEGNTDLPRFRQQAHRVLRAVRADVRFQARQGMYTVYGVLTLMYLLLLSSLSDSVRYWAVPIIVFSDPSILGFVFIGGMVMLEKSQGILRYLAVTPLSAGEYILAKLLSLGLLAEVAGGAIAAVTAWGNYNPLLLGLAILPGSIFFTLCGLFSTAGCSTMNRYFLQMAPGMLLITIPCLLPLLWGWHPLLMLIPPVAALRLVMGAFHGLESWEIVLCTVVLLVWDIGLWRVVTRWFHRRIAVGVVAS